MQNIMKVENKISYISEDYDIGSQKCSFHISSSEYLLIVYENYYHNVINGPIRNAKTTAIIIENIFANSMKTEIPSL